MNKILLTLTAAALLSGCEKLAGNTPEQKAAAREAAALAEAKVASKLAALKTGGPAAGAAAGKAGEALVSLLCASPGLMEDVENNLYLLEALSGEGGGAEEVRRHVLDARAQYSAVLRKSLPERGASYEEFLAYAGRTLPGLAAPEGKLAFKTFVKEKCPGRAALAETAAAGMIRYCADPAY